MQVSEPKAGEAWPHEVTIMVDEKPSVLLELLWVREAYELRPSGEDLPPALIDRPEVEIKANLDEATRDEWKVGWPGLWRDAVAHAGLDQVQIVGPNWYDRFGDKAFIGSSFKSWMNRQVAPLASVQIPEEPPERRNLPTLIPAWRAGLTKVVTIPCIGSHTKRINPNALLVTVGTRANPTEYRAALQSFAESSKQ